MVANLPYNVSVPVLLNFLERFASITSGLVMVQAEVANRLAAGPGSRTYGVPSVKAAWYADVALAGTISRSVFWPVPNVDSALVSLHRRPHPTSDGKPDDDLRRRTFDVVDAAFAQRRKTLRSALARLAGSPAEAEQALIAAGVDPGLRGEQLDVGDFARIARVLGLLG
jgi:16S rRNA (adenine1518-N6/adenine1519-N6)-dimethyltransferase